MLCREQRREGLLIRGSTRPHPGEVGRHTDHHKSFLRLRNLRAKIPDGMSNNRTRVLGEVLSLDAWHDPFRCNGETSGVFVELSFHEGRLGGEESNIPFTFKIELKRALLTV